MLSFILIRVQTHGDQDTHSTESAVEPRSPDPSKGKISSVLSTGGREGGREKSCVFQLNSISHQIFHRIQTPVIFTAALRKLNI